MLSRLRNWISPRQPPPRRQLVVVGHDVSDYRFGAERSLLDILAAVDPRRFKVTCVLPAHNDGYLAAAARLTPDVVVFPYRWRHARQPPDPDTLARFTALFRDRRADLVHVNTITLCDPLLAARAARIPSIVHARELIGEDPHLAALLGESPADIVARVRAEADFIIANSDATHAHYCTPGRGFRLYNCVDTAHVDLPPPLDAGPLRVGMLSSNLPKKGLDAFAELAQRATTCDAPMRFVVFGPRTTETDRLWPGAWGGPATGNLRLAGYVADPVDALRQLDVVASFSEVPESFGRSLAEAMAARRPVIGFNQGAPRELVRHGVDGFLVPPRDIAGALAHLETLARDPARVHAMGAAGRARAVALFATDTFAQQLNAIYARILGDPER